LHHVLLDRWSQGASPLHRIEARAKILTLLVFLMVLASTPPDAALVLVTDAVLLVAASLIARLPVLPILLRSLVVLPFSLTFALMSWLAGEPMRGLGLVEKSYLAAFGALLLAATTPMSSLLGGLAKLGAPRLLIFVAQFLYRYLFVISEQAQHMRLAAACRQGNAGARRAFGFRGAAGALAVLFARSYNRAEGIYRAMLARGFSGRFSILHHTRFGMRDAAFLVGVSLFLILARLG